MTMKIVTSVSKNPPNFMLLLPFKTVMILIVVENIHNFFACSFKMLWLNGYKDVVKFEGFSKTDLTLHIFIIVNTPGYKNVNSQTPS